MRAGFAAVLLALAGCGGPPGRVEILARVPAGVLSIAAVDGDIWVGTGDGLLRLPAGRGPGEAFSDAAGFTGGLKQARWIAPRGGDLLVATGGGIAVFSRTERKVVRVWTSRDGLAADSTRWVGEVRGGVWAGTIFGASRLSADGKRWKTWKIAQGLSQDHVYRMADDGRTAWASCMNGGLARFDPRTDRFTAIPQVRGLGNKHIYAMAPDAATGLWLGTAGGVNLFRGDPPAWDETVCADGYTDYTVYAVLPAGRTIWFGTAFGLSRRNLDTGAQVTWTAAAGLPHSEITGLLPADRGVIAATKLGVARITE